jgi:4-diphosphocytidyl-2-C-methyl-D-erythritol kinase
MNLRQNEPLRIVHAPAKLNLLLEVLSRRDDGYHELATWMTPIRLFDTLAFRPTSALVGKAADIEFSLHTRDGTGAVPAGERNLVVRALELLRRRSGCDAGARVALVKRIPSGAGLGGGSSDAAAALSVANQAWRIGWSTRQLLPLAVELGSDVPFFLERGPAICRGRGEQVERLPGNQLLDFVIVKPPVSLATAEVYGALNRLPAGDPPARESAERRLASLTGAIRRRELGKLRRWMGNHLQAAAAILSDWIDRVREAFAGLDSLAHQLSGSGSAYFGVCRHARHARRLATVLRTRQLGLVFVTRSYG